MASGKCKGKECAAYGGVPVLRITVVQPPPTKTVFVWGRDRTGKMVRLTLRTGQLVCMHGLWTPNSIYVLVYTSGGFEKPILKVQATAKRKYVYIYSVCLHICFSGKKFRTAELISTKLSMLSPVIPGKVWNIILIGPRQKETKSPVRKYWTASVRIEIVLTDKQTNTCFMVLKWNDFGRQQASWLRKSHPFHAAAWSSCAVNISETRRNEGPLAHHLDRKNGWSSRMLHTLYLCTSQTPFGV